MKEDRYIEAGETKPSPGARRVVHHSVETLVYDNGTNGGGTLLQYAVGEIGDMFPEGSGKLMKAGADLEAIYPDMRVEQVNCVNYDFNWQIVYNWCVLHVRVARAF